MTRRRFAAFAGAFKAAVFMAYAIRPDNSRKTNIGSSFANTAKTTSDVGKTMSYVEKIMSDVIQTTSDIIFAVASL